jgi:hypothetical protein
LIFYEFYKFQPNIFYYLRNYLHRDPLKLSNLHTYALGSHKRPWKDWNRCNWVPAHGSGQAHRNPTALAGLLAEEGDREEGELTTARFVAGEGVEAAPASSTGGEERRRPPWFGFWQGDQRDSPTSECLGPSVMWGRCWGCWPVTETSGGRSSAATLQWRAAVGLTRNEKGATPIYRWRAVCGSKPSPRRLTRR